VCTNANNLFEIIGDCGDEYRWSFADRFDHSKDTDVEVKIYWLWSYVNNFVYGSWIEC
jgi:hypothetical protein